MTRIFPDPGGHATSKKSLSGLRIAKFCALEAPFVQNDLRHRAGRRRKVDHGIDLRENTPVHSSTGLGTKPTPRAAEGNCKEAPCFHRAAVSRPYGIVEMARADLLAEWEEPNGSSGLHSTR